MSAACSPRPVYPGRCHLLDWCRTTPWTSCNNPQINLMDRKLFLSVHSPSSQTPVGRGGNGHTYVTWTSTGSRDIFFFCIFLSHTHRSAQPTLPYFSVSPSRMMSKVSWRKFQSSGGKSLTWDRHILTALRRASCTCWVPIACWLFCPHERRSKLWAVLNKYSVCQYRFSTSHLCKECHCSERLSHVM